MLSAEVINLLIPAVAGLIGYWLRHKGISLPFFTVPQATPATPAATDQHPLLNTLDLLAKVQEALKGIIQQPGTTSTQQPK